MKLKFIKFLSVLFLLSSSINLAAQKPKTTVTKKQNPASFTISKTDFDNLFTKKPKEVLTVSNNKFLDKCSVIMSSLNGDTKFMKIKLHYFQNAFLMVQVNGAYSTQVFIMSDDKSVFYKGRLENGAVIMTKCNEDDIVSE